MNKSLLRKIGWSIVLFVGLVLIIGLPDSMVLRHAAPPVSAAIAPPPIVVYQYNKKTHERKAVIIDDPSRQVIIEAPKEPEKDWTDYMDKIVGWIVALAGAWNLFRRPNQSPKNE